MTLVDMKQNKSYQISKIITNDDVLRERLVALGICEGTKTALLEKSLDKSTIAILSNNTRIALRATEAKEVFIKEV
ncbi:FeoA family protein [Helicobacter sp. MIT 14-3879]|uniref:FeoA family protein n=1 Tax=Helicobacter sp. MIT 14-3879 TaxID=2040649 RepID=UPI0015F14030|nr:FeoA family protein [Helicobacter sp. MIT 14-3879]